MACWRASRIRLIAGNAHFHTKHDTMANATMPAISSFVSGSTKETFEPSDSASPWARIANVMEPNIDSLLSDKEENETDEGECLSKGGTEEHRGPDGSCHFGLPGHGGDGIAYDDADTDVRADSTQAISD